MDSIKIEKNHRYLTIAVYAFLTVLAVIVCYWMLNNLSAVKQKAGSVLGVLTPFIWGISLAYVLNPVLIRAERMLDRSKYFTQHRNVKRGVAVCIAVLVLILILGAFVGLLVPELYASIKELAANLNAYAEKVSHWLSGGLVDYLVKLDISPDAADAMLEPLYSKLDNWTDYVSVALPVVLSVLTDAVISLKDIMVAVIVMVYLLVGKERFLAQWRKLLYAFTTRSHSRAFLEWSAHTNRIFSGYVTGNLLDALIIGCLTFIILNVLRVEYAIIISVVVGVTNLIPFFGPFIGAIPSALLLVLVSPKQALIFLIVILVIQLVDGYIIKPNILGNTTGLSSFWVVFAVIVAGGLFGVLGMFIGVPVFAVVYSLIKAIVEGRLVKKQLSVETEDYLAEVKSAIERPRPKHFSRRKDKMRVAKPQETQENEEK